VIGTVLTLGLLACGGGGDAADHSWVDASGQPVPTSTVLSFAGHEHCDWEDSVWIYFAGGFYLNDPHHVVYGPGETAFPNGQPRPATRDDLYQAVDEVPPAARDTGLRQGEAELWTNPEEDGEAIYLVTGDLIERLPRTFWGCD
jgi:hypothetical protein